MAAEDFSFLAGVADFTNTDLRHPQLELAPLAEPSIAAEVSSFLAGDRRCAPETHAPLAGLSSACTSATCLRDSQAGRLMLVGSSSSQFDNLTLCKVHACENMSGIRNASTGSVRWLLSEFASHL